MSRPKYKDLVKGYLEKYPEMPSLSMAKLIYQEHTQIFKSVEQTRRIIRYYRGSSGKINRQTIERTDRRFIRDFDPKYLNPFGLPESDERELDPFIIPTGYKRILVFGDVHVPYHSIAAHNAMITWALKRKPDCIILNGDMIDLYQCSKFTKDPRQRNLVGEVDALNEYLYKLIELFPNTKFYYKEGNHEERLENFLRVKAPELLGMDEFRLDSILKLGEKGIHYIREKRIIKLNKLNILHGHELKGGLIPPVNPARGIFLRASAITLANHFHRTSEHTEPNLDGKMISCWSVGCMCELQQAYMPYGKANHGFAWVDIQDGKFSVLNKRIYNGRVL